MEKSRTKIRTTIFSFDVYSYSVNDILAHTIQSLSVEAKANAENAKVEIVVMMN